jgi:hypothetical protein
MIQPISTQWKLQVEKLIHPSNTKEQLSIAGHMIRMAHIRESFPLSAWYTWEVMDAYIELLNASGLCLALKSTPKEDQKQHEALAMRMQFYAVLADQTRGATGLDPDSYNNGIDAKTISSYRTIIVPIFTDFGGGHYSLVHVQSRAKSITLYDTLLGSRTLDNSTRQASNHRLAVVE